MKEIIEKQRRYFNTGATLPLAFRAERLERLKKSLHAFEPQLLAALQEDLGKVPFEGYETELGILYEEINFTLKHFKAWASPERVPTPLVHFPAKSRIYTEPLGVVLILSPWNYPLQLTIAPLIAAISAGDCAVVKPSRYSPATSAVIEQMLNQFFDQEYISVFQGGSQVNTELLQLKYDHIFFTGSPHVGRIVMEAAAKNLTPVTLELGGKSPCIVDETADIALAARRIAWGKLINAGQTCVAPDYALVQDSVKDEFIKAYIASIKAFYGEDTLHNEEYCKIINDKHFNRLSGLLSSGTVAFGGKTDEAARRIEPTVLTDVSPDSPVMQEEIFGPILPVLPYHSFTEAEDFVKSGQKPLALYLFTANPQHELRVLNEVPFGGGCVNDTIVHLGNPNMHFGGVGESGMGSYHGRTGFYTFSHRKSVLKKSNLIDIPLRYAPYGNRLGLLKKLMK
jgi:aldehyde dehydrogenase (NAD+)